MASAQNVPTDVQNMLDNSEAQNILDGQFLDGVFLAIEIDAVGAERFLVAIVRDAEHHAEKANLRLVLHISGQRFCRICLASSNVVF
jgi:hypothetical protein